MTRIVCYAGIADQGTSEGDFWWELDFSLCNCSSIVEWEKDNMLLQGSKDTLSQPGVVFLFYLWEVPIGSWMLLTLIYAIACVSAPQPRHGSWPPTAQLLSAEDQWFEFYFLSLANHGFPQPQPPCNCTPPSGVLTAYSYFLLLLCILLWAGLLLSCCMRRRGSMGRSVTLISCGGNGPEPQPGHRAALWWVTEGQGGP